jgi:hypothetical protein
MQKEIFERRAIRHDRHACSKPRRSDLDGIDLAGAVACSTGSRSSCGGPWHACLVEKR